MVQKSNAIKDDCLNTPARFNYACAADNYCLAVWDAWLMNDTITSLHLALLHACVCFHRWLSKKRRVTLKRYFKIRSDEWEQKLQRPNGINILPMYVLFKKNKQTKNFQTLLKTTKHKNHFVLTPNDRICNETWENNELIVFHLWHSIEKDHVPQLQTSWNHRGMWFY